MSRCPIWKISARLGQQWYNYRYFYYRPMSIGRNSSPAYSSGTGLPITSPVRVRPTTLTGSGSLRQATKQLGCHRFDALVGYTPSARPTTGSESRLGIRRRPHPRGDGSWAEKDSGHIALRNPQGGLVDDVLFGASELFVRRPLHRDRNVPRRRFVAFRCQ